MHFQLFKKKKKIDEKNKKETKQESEEFKQTKIKILEFEEIEFLKDVDIDLVTPFGNLFIASYKGSAFENLQKLSITHVLTVLDNAEPNFDGSNIKSHVVDIIDVSQENILIHFENAFKFIKEGVENVEGRVLIHCRKK